MKSKLSLLVKDGLNKKLNTKWFKIINIILLVVIVGLLNIDNIIKSFGGDFDKDKSIYVFDETNAFYSSLESMLAKTDALEMVNLDYTVKKPEKTIEELKEEIKKDESADIILDITNENGEYKVNIISYKYVDAITLQIVSTSLNTIKTNLKVAESNLSAEEIESIFGSIEVNREYLSEELDENYELVQTLGNFVIPAFIMPFFFLLIMVTSMIGAEINEEKTSKSMEIIITSVSPKIHFLAKMITSNIYAILQCVLFVAYAALGLIVRTTTTGQSIKLTESFGETGNKLIKTFIDSGMLDNLLKCLPYILILLVLSFVAFSLLSGILASMTTSAEDYSQLQTPLMMLIMLGYFVAIFSTTYEKSTFIIILSMIPFLSCIISPVLLILGQISLVHVLISVILVCAVIFVLVRYGLRIYKVGILNYSSNNLWKKMFKSLKEKDA